LANIPIYYFSCCWGVSGKRGRFVEVTDFRN